MKPQKKGRGYKTEGQENNNPHDYPLGIWTGYAEKPYNGKIQKIMGAEQDQQIDRYKAYDF